VVDRSPHRRIAGFDWSPDGRWLAYGFSATPQTTEIRLFHLLDEGQAEAEVEGEGDAEEDVEIKTESGDESAETQAGAPNPIRITKPVLHDAQPAFDPTGRYLYFISAREFNPVYDGLHFDLGFPWGMRPYLLTLREDLPNPFTPHPELESDQQDGDKDDKDEDKDEGKNNNDAGDGDDEESAPNEETDPQESEEEDGETGTSQRLNAAAEGEQSADSRLFEVGTSSKKDEQKQDASKKTDKRGNKAPLLQIDLEGIERRILAFPVHDGRYGQIAGVKDKALFTEFPIQGTLDSDDWQDDEQDIGGALRAYDFKEFKGETLADNVSWFALSRNREKLIYASGSRLRVISAGDKAPSENGHPRKTGWLDLSRIKVSVDPQSEWEQMFQEAWRLQRDHFWTEDMSHVDWRRVFERYFPLIERVSSRGEFSDLMWEMQGELGTSHAYEFGGDYRPRPYYGQGFLGAPLIWDAEAGGYRVGEPVIGDVWDAKANSPLANPGVDVEPGDLLLALNGQSLDAETGPGQLLVNQAGNEVLLTFADDDDSGDDDVDESVVDGSVDSEPESGDMASQDVEHADDADDGGAKTRSVIVRTLASETPARYRAWVEDNRRRVHEATDGRVGYVHIPDMGPRGYAEFHRGYLAEIDRDALIVDVRYNGGGHVSQLILEKLARRRLGYDLSRWGGMMPYPMESVAGPLVALTDEHAGSDGDIFSHSFKLMKLGPLIGKRTWGGVIGIWPRHSLVDGTVTTQPEYSFWFEDMGWNVENYGTDPDIEVDISPQDYVAGQDPQLERGIEEILRLLEATPIVKPDLKSRPSRALPTLPPRT
jgi:tricorn protease